MWDFKYLRIQGREKAAQTGYEKGVFSMCWSMIQNHEMDEEDAELYREIDSWIADILPYPPQCNAQDKVVCFFKTENFKELAKRIRPAMWLLERYHHPYYVVLTNDPGEIVYEDEYQIAVRLDDSFMKVEKQQSWTEDDAVCNKK